MQNQSKFSLRWIGSYSEFVILGPFHSVEHTHWQHTARTGKQNFKSRFANILSGQRDLVGMEKQNFQSGLFDVGLLFVKIKEEASFQKYLTF